MKKKGVLLLIILFVTICTTGCTATYTLKYENDIFTEELYISGSEDNEESPLFDDAHPTFEDIVDNGLYADIHGKEYFEISPDSTSFDVTLTHELNEVKLEDLKAVSECFALSTYREGEGIYSIALYGKFTCDFLEESSFILETDAKVLKENAHQIEGNKYIWNLSEEDLGDEGITFQIMRTTVEGANVRNDTMIPITLKIFIGILIFAATCGLIFLLKKGFER